MSSALRWGWVVSTTPGPLYPREKPGTHCAYSLGTRFKSVGRDSSVGIAICYGLDGPGIETRWEGEIFRTRTERPCGPPSLLYNGCRVFLPGVKRPGRGVNHTPPIWRRGWSKSRVIPLLPFWAFVAFSRATFTFTFHPFQIPICFRGFPAPLSSAMP